MRKHFLSFLVIMLAVGVLAPTVLAQGAIFSGVVVDEDGNPLPGATVVAEMADANPPRFEQQTDENGRWSMIGLASGEWMVTVEAEGFHPSPGPIQLRFGVNPPSTIDLNRIRHPLVVALGDEAFEGLDPDVIEQNLEAADAAYNDAQWQAAIDGYSEILEQLPIMNDLHMQIGIAHRQLENYDEAIGLFEQAREGDASLESEVEAEIARTRMAMGDFDAVGDALAGANSSREDLYNLGELEFAKGEVDTAAGWYEMAAAADPNWAKPLFKLALVALNKGDTETAKTFFAQVVDKEPDSEEAVQAQAVLSQLP